MCWSFSLFSMSILTSNIIGYDEYLVERAHTEMVSSHNAVDSTAVGHTRIHYHVIGQAISIYRGARAVQCSSGARPLFSQDGYARSADLHTLARVGGSRFCPDISRSDLTRCTRFVG